MVDHDSSRILEELGGLVPDRRPPLPELMTLVRDSKRKRDRRRRMLAAAIAGTSLASAVLLYGHFNSNADNRDLVASPGSTPVISMPEDDGGFPMAEVTGQLKLVAHCLMLDDSAVFWPHGTTWDSNARTVVFSDEFDAPPLEVGSSFVGGGGYYTVRQALDILGPEYGQPLGACAGKSQSNQVIYAVPAG